MPCVLFFIVGSGCLVVKRGMSYGLIYQLAEG